ncbi:SRPBCC family protein [Actinomycetospora sp. OC33-EN08]|uniref:SRPBCC family protein n=1 Tax=Actinomycetospora aurantiaca TaxID=3129233 RepID=A0ABU8MV67_9PSEU
MTTTTDETLVVTRRVDAPAERVFAVLTDPAKHAAIDGTGWVCEPIHPERLTAPGQVFGMGMYHSNHPDGHYEIHNRVEVLDPPRAIAWQPGSYTDDGSYQLGGWWWRYDLEPDGGACRVSLTYDWSQVPAPVREVITFPPFGVGHLERALENLARLTPPS